MNKSESETRLIASGLLMSQADAHHC